MRGRRWHHWLVFAVNGLGIVACLSLVFVLRSGQTRAEAVQRVRLDGTLTDIADAGPAGSRVLNILIVGSDSSANLDPDDPIQTGRAGERNGDVIMIAHLDERTGDAALLSIPRDLWVELPGYDRQQRINAAFAIGGPPLLIDTIEAEFDIPIHHYVDLDFAGFRGLVEAVDHVEVPFPTDARDFDVELGQSRTGFEVEAGCVPLGPTEALAYVRSRHYQTLDAEGRWVTDPTSDLGRIARQQDFLRRFADRVIAAGGRNPFVASQLVDAALEHVIVDHELTAGQLLGFADAFDSLVGDDVRSYGLPVSDLVTEGKQVLAWDESRARPVLALFAGARADSPDTVAVRWEGPDDDDRLAALERWEPVALTAADGPDGADTAIAHRSGEESVAGLVAEALAVDVDLVVDDSLDARTVVVRAVVSDTDEGSPPATTPPESETSTTTTADGAEAAAEAALAAELAACGR